MQKIICKKVYDTDTARVVFKKTEGEGFTIRADKPHAEIDYICLYTGKGAKAEVTSHTVIHAPVESDHSPIVADIIITE